MADAFDLEEFAVDLIAEIPEMRQVRHALRDENRSGY